MTQQVGTTTQGCDVLSLNSIKKMADASPPALLYKDVEDILDTSGAGNVIWSKSLHSSNRAVESEPALGIGDKGSYLRCHLLEGHPPRGKKNPKKQ